MADPATMATIGIGSSIANTFLGIGAARQSAGASASSNFYQAGVAQINARIAAQNADYASIKGEKDAMRYGMQARQRSGEIIAGQSASGLDIGSGSAVDVRKSQDTISQMDMAQIREDAAKVAFNYRQQASQFTNDAMMSMRAGRSSQAAGNINALSSLVGGAGSVASKWLEAKKMGVFSLMNFNFGV